MEANDGSVVPVVWRSFEVYWTMSYVIDEWEGAVKAWHNLHVQVCVCACMCVYNLLYVCLLMLAASVAVRYEIVEAG